MPALSPELLYKTAAFLYAVTVPGHVVMGYQVVYPALSKIPKATSQESIGERGAANCWNFLTTSLAASALLHWQWARTAGPSTPEEITILLGTNLHTLINGLRYMQVNEYKAGLGITVPSLLGLAAFVLQRAL